ncbi:MAG: type II/IV secretion system ATPase subunit, partial [Candidatus Thermoplasmatota archaeon]|nr:type II/IV secretion system ATPase subunit [Candidatus Thermoplasmatota archaeon]MBU1940288.1 type II/IV secretion system ATPase subunit [Candidatus Thermoplasmatota archaeon]
QTNSATQLPRPQSSAPPEKPQFYNNLRKKTQTTTQQQTNIPPQLESQPKKGFKKIFHKHKTSTQTYTPPEMIPQKETSVKTIPTTAFQELSSIPINPKRAGINDIGQLKTLIIQDLGYSDGTWDELDFYPLLEPFAYVEIIREKKTLDKRYIVIEVELTNKELELLKFIRESLNSINVDAKELETKGDREYLKDQVEQIIQDYSLNLNEQTKKKLVFYIEKQYLGLEKLEVLMRDPNIEDISCDGSNVPLFLYHRRYGSLRSNVVFPNEEELASFVIKLAQKCGKHISIAEPMLDATMPDGSRIQMTLSTEITTKGSTFTIRKFMEDPFSPPDLIEFNTMSSEMVAYMWLAVENGVNALIAGGTAAGKTSALNAISLFIPRESKIVSIEETREINLPHPNWIPGVARSGFGEVVGDKIMGEIDLYDLMKAALRQRPEYILVGEIRGREAYVLFQAMATGHTTYSTVHADSAQSLIHRLEGKPINIPRIMLQSLDIVCIHVISRVKNKRARRCKQIIEIIDIDPTTKEILTNEVFRWDPVEDKFVYSGKSYILERIRAEKDLSRDEMTQELHNRAHVLQWMNENNIREFKKVAVLIAQYVDNPKETLKKLQAE